MKLLTTCALWCVAFSTGTSPSDGPAKQRIAWYGTLKDGVAESQRTGRPIMLVSAAPACLGVSGIW